MFESENYRNYLVAMSKFHHYSYSNSIQIILQNLEATYVADYNAWQDKFKCHVKKGEKGIQIIGFALKNVTKRKREKTAFPFLAATLLFRFYK